MNSLLEWVPTVDDDQTITIVLPDVVMTSRAVDLQFQMIMEGYLCISGSMNLRSHSCRASVSRYSDKELDLPAIRIYNCIQVKYQ